MIVRVAVAVRIHGEFHAENQGNAVTAGRQRRTDLDRPDIGARGHTPRATDDIGHVGAVSGKGARHQRQVIQRVRVGQRRIRKPAGAGGPHVAKEVKTRRHLGGGECSRLNKRPVIGDVIGGIAGAAEVGVGVVNAAVQYGHADAGAVQPGGLHGCRADVGHGLIQRQLVVADRGHPLDIRVGSDAVQCLGRYIQEHRVKHVLGAADFANRVVLCKRAAQECVLLVLNLVLAAAPHTGAVVIHVASRRRLQSHDHSLAPGRANQRGIERRFRARQAGVVQVYGLGQLELCER